MLQVPKGKTAAVISADAYLWIVGNVLGTERLPIWQAFCQHLLIRGQQEDPGLHPFADQ